MRVERVPGKSATVMALTAAMVVGSWQIVSAHHSGAMYDSEHVSEVSGTVTEWRYTNPHSWLMIAADEPGPEGAEWRFEAPNAGTAIRRGIYRNSIEAGQHVVVAHNPRRDGVPEGNLVSVTFDDGSVLQVSRGPAGAQGGDAPAGSE